MATWVPWVFSGSVTSALIPHTSCSTSLAAPRLTTNMMCKKTYSSLMSLFFISSLCSAPKACSRHCCPNFKHHSRNLTLIDVEFNFELHQYLWFPFIFGQKNLHGMLCCLLFHHSLVLGRIVFIFYAHTVYLFWKMFRPYAEWWTPAEVKTLMEKTSVIFFSFTVVYLLLLFSAPVLDLP